jgi:hypothetical protein
MLLNMIAYLPSATSCWVCIQSLDVIARRGAEAPRRGNPMFSYNRLLED